MENNIVRVYYGTIMEEEEDITLVQLCNYCRLEPGRIIEMVEEGILDPSGRSKNEWRFTFTSVERVRKVQRLRRDFELSIQGAALALDLLDRIEELEKFLPGHGYRD